MKDTFIERAIEYPIEYGKLVVYESNTTCESIPFKFDHHVITIMMAGQKSILVEGKRYEFFPGTLLIPRKDVINNVKIPVASKQNPTMCLELDLHPIFIKDFYNELLNSKNASELLNEKDPDAEKLDFMSNDKKLIDLLTRTFQRRTLGDDLGNQMIVSLMVKSLMIDLFQTPALHLFLSDLSTTNISKPIRETLKYINENLAKKIPMNTLSEISGLGLTSFFNKFKKELNLTPNEYITNQRIALAKSYLRNGGYSLKSAAFSCGFNSYEHFSSTFKKIEKMTPSKYLQTL